jgi:hypothetical protein
VMDHYLGDDNITRMPYVFSKTNQICKRKSFTDDQGENSTQTHGKSSEFHAERLASCEERSHGRHRVQHFFTTAVGYHTASSDLLILPWGLGFHEHLTSPGAHATIPNK